MVADTSNFIYKGLSERLGANILVSIAEETEQLITLTIQFSSLYDGSDLDMFAIEFRKEDVTAALEAGTLVGSIEEAYLELNQMDKDQYQRLHVSVH